jgi:hypothetical protein
MDRIHRLVGKNAHCSQPIVVRADLRHPLTWCFWQPDCSWKQRKNPDTSQPEQQGSGSDDLPTHKRLGIITTCCYQ